MKYQNLYSETTGKQPAASAVEVGEIWINIKDFLLGTKDSSGNIIPFAQLTATERTKLRDIDLSKYVPTSGTISKSTMDKATAASASFTINDSTASVIELSSSANLTATITASKTTGYKATTVIVKKPIGNTCTLTFSGIDSWIGDSPTFTGTSTKIEYLILRVETNPNLNTATVLVNTQYPISTVTSWGSITGTLSNQTDLKNALANKADSSTVTALAKTVDGKADSSTVTELSDTVSALSDTVDTKADASTVTTLSNTVAGKADSSTVSTLSSKVATLDTTVAGKADSSTVTALTKTVDGKADSTTVTTLSDKVSTLSTTVEGKADSSTVTALSKTVANKADSTTVSTLSSKVSTLSDTVDTLSDTVDTKADSSTVTTLSNTVASKADSSTVTALSKTVDGKANTSDVTSLQTTLQADIDTRALKKDLESAVTSLNAAITRITALETKLVNVTNADGTLSIAQTIDIT